MFYSVDGQRLSPAVNPGKLGLVVSPRLEREIMSEMIAGLALRGPVRVLDGGNSYDAFRVARLVRRQTHQLAEIQGRITVARAFTCFQVLTLFEQTSATREPGLALDLLATFGDENISVKESHRLLDRVMAHLDRLRRSAPIVVSIRPPRQPDRQGLVEALKERADHVFIRESPATMETARLL